jgi:hypothetical protein
MPRKSVATGTRKLSKKNSKKSSRKSKTLDITEEEMLDIINSESNQHKGKAKRAVGVVNQQLPEGVDALLISSGVNVGAKGETSNYVNSIGNLLGVTSLAALNSVPQYVKESNNNMNFSEQMPMSMTGSEIGMNLNASEQMSMKMPMTAQQMPMTGLQMEMPMAMPSQEMQMPVANNQISMGNNIQQLSQQQLPLQQMIKNLANLSTNPVRIA